MTLGLRLFLLVGLFAVLGAADYLLTARLVRPGDLGVHEGNPLAAWVLGRYGWGGLAAFKVVSMGVVAGLALIVARQRPWWGQGLLAFACLTVAVVVVYSVGLLHGPNPGEAGDSPELARSRQAAQELDRRMNRAQTYQKAVRQAARELHEGRITLAEAVARVEGEEQGRDPAWHKTLRVQYSPLEDRDSLLAASLVQNALAEASHERQGEVGRRLTREFRQLYDQDLPGRLAEEIAAAASAQISS